MENKVGRSSCRRRCPAATVLLDGKPIVTEFKDVPPPETDTRLGDLPAGDRTLMVNFGGHFPRRDSLQLVRDICPFYESPKFGYWAFKKLEFGWAHMGLYLDGNCNLVEDCYFHEIFHARWAHAAAVYVQTVQLPPVLQFLMPVGIPTSSRTAW